MSCLIDGEQIRKHLAEHLGYLDAGARQRMRAIFANNVGSDEFLEYVEKAGWMGRVKVGGILFGNIPGGAFYYRREDWKQRLKNRESRKARNATRQR